MDLVRLPQRTPKANRPIKVMRAALRLHLLQKSVPPNNKDEPSTLQLGAPGVERLLRLQDPVRYGQQTNNSTGTTIVHPTRQHLAPPPPHPPSLALPQLSQPTTSHHESKSRNRREKQRQPKPTPSLPCLTMGEDESQKWSKSTSPTGSSLPTPHQAVPTQLTVFKGIVY